MYSAYRDVVLNAISKPGVVKISKSECPHLQDVGLPDFYALVLPFDKSIELSKIVERVQGEGGVSQRFNDDKQAVAWIVSNGIVDADACPFFSEEDVLTKLHVEVPLFLVWKVLEANNFSNKDKQATVGN